MLTEDERLRYARHISLPGFGEEGQLRLRNGSVLVIGAGGLGSPVLLYLAAAGVGHIGVADGDVVDTTNLQRQVIHTTASVGMSKVKSAAAKMRALNPDVEIEEFGEYVNESNIAGLIAGYDFVIDATDSIDIKFLINDACVKAGKPYNHGAIFQYEGHTMTVLPGSADLRTLFPDGPSAVDRSAPVGPLGVVPGVLGTLQATEAIKYVSGVGELLVNRLLCFDLLTMQFTCLRI